MNWDNLYSDSNLSKKERDKLNNLNITENTKTAKSKHDSDFINLPLSLIISKWSVVINDIIHDLANLNYKQTITDNSIFTEAEHEVYHQKWWLYITAVIKDIIYILTKSDRLIYVGLTLIIVSFIVYFIMISS